MTRPVPFRRAALAVLPLLGAAACSGGTSPASTPAAVTASATPSAVPSAVPTPSTVPTTSAAAAASTATATSTAASPADDGPPPGVATTPTVDLDGDGRPDVLWLGDVDGQRTLGATTTSHGTSSVPATSADPQEASAVAVLLRGATPVVLLDTGRSVRLLAYRVEGPGLVAVPDGSGQPYTFSLGFTPYGTGVQCAPGADGDRLYGLNVVDRPDGAVDVTRTEVVVDANRLHARNGATETVVQDVAPASAAARAAHGLDCGDGQVVGEPVD